MSRRSSWSPGCPVVEKSTLARALAEPLGLPVIHKDVILESLFDSLGVGDHASRHRLSRAADEVLLTIATGAKRAVLDNWWHHDSAPDRLHGLGDRLIEVHCECDVEQALRRFVRRRRHPGHLDPQPTQQQFAARVDHGRPTFRGPLRLGGPLFVVDTTESVGVAALAAEVAGALGDFA